MLTLIDPSGLPNAVRDAVVRHIDRQFGNTGLQIVTIDVSNGGRYMFSYTVGRLWKRLGRSCRSLLWIIQPKSLVGTVVMLDEQAAIERSNIWLRLRTAHAPIAIDLARSYEPVLGTDFSYVDFRWWIPFDTVLSATAEESWLNGEPVTILRAKKPTLHPGARSVVVTLCRKTNTVEEIIWSDQDDTASRVFKVDAFTEIDGIRTPLVISAIRPLQGYCSVMSLVSCKYNLTIDQALFDQNSVTTDLLRWFSPGLS